MNSQNQPKKGDKPAAPSKKPLDKSPNERKPTERKFGEKKK